MRGVAVTPRASPASAARDRATERAGGPVSCPVQRAPRGAPSSRDALSAGPVRPAPTAEAGQRGGWERLRSHRSEAVRSPAAHRPLRHCLRTTRAGGWWVRPKRRRWCPPAVLTVGQLHPLAGRGLVAQRKAAQPCSCRFRIPYTTPQSAPRPSTGARSRCIIPTPATPPSRITRARGRINSTRIA